MLVGGVQDGRAIVVGIHPESLIDEIVTGRAVVADDRDQVAALLHRHGQAAPKL
jgi:hypothetical protein